MTDEILKRIDTLAEQLGTTSEFVFSTLADGIFRIHLVCMFLSIIGIVVAGLFLWKVGQRLRKEEVLQDGEEVTYGFIGISSIVIFFFSIIGFIVNLSYTVAPQYYALQEITRIFKD